MAAACPSHRGTGRPCGTPARPGPSARIAVAHVAQRLPPYGPDNEQGRCQSSSLRQNLSIWRARTRHTRLVSRPPRTPPHHESVRKTAKKRQRSRKSPVFSGRNRLHAGAQADAEPPSRGCRRADRRAGAEARRFLTPPAGKPTATPPGGLVPRGCVCQPRLRRRAVRPRSPGFVELPEGRDPAALPRVPDGRPTGPTASRATSGTGPAQGAAKAPAKPRIGGCQSA